MSQLRNVHYLTHANYVRGLFSTTHICRARASARNFKHQAPNISNTTRAANIGAKLQYQAFNIHILYSTLIKYNIITTAMSEPTLFVRDYNIRP